MTVELIEEVFKKRILRSPIEKDADQVFFLFEAFKPFKKKLNAHLQAPYDKEYPFYIYPINHIIVNFFKAHRQHIGPETEKSGVQILLDP